MTWKDKLEIGLKEDAPYRKDNLPESEVSGPEIPSGPGRSPEIPHARRADAKSPVQSSTHPTPPKPRRVVHARVGSSKRPGSAS
jgi:hypothetical protein